MDKVSKRHKRHSFLSWIQNFLKFTTCRVFDLLSSIRIIIFTWNDWSLLTDLTRQIKPSKPVTHPRLRLTPPRGLQYFYNFDFIFLSYWTFERLYFKNRERILRIKNYLCSSYIVASLRVINIVSTIVSCSNRKCNAHFENGERDAKTEREQENKNPDSYTRTTEIVS